MKWMATKVAKNTDFIVAVFTKTKYEMTVRVRYPTQHKDNNGLYLALLVGKYSPTITAAARWMAYGIEMQQQLINDIDQVSHRLSTIGNTRGEWLHKMFH